MTGIEVQGAQKNQSETLFDMLGGATSIDAVVDNFYRRVLTDDRISAFFDTIDMEDQHRKQKSFLTMVMGGPNGYTGKDMRQAHKHMNLTEVHFNAVAECLLATLNDFDVPQERIDDVMAIALSVKADVLNQ